MTTQLTGAIEMTYDYFIVELMKAKRQLENIANDAEEAGYKVNLGFGKDTIRDRCNARPHSVIITLSKEVK